MHLRANQWRTHHTSYCSTARKMSHFTIAALPPCSAHTLKCTDPCPVHELIDTSRLTRKIPLLCGAHLALSQLFGFTYLVSPGFPAQSCSANPARHLENSLAVNPSAARLEYLGRVQSTWFHPHNKRILYDTFRIQKLTTPGVAFASKIASRCIPV